MISDAESYVFERFGSADTAWINTRRDEAGAKGRSLLRRSHLRLPIKVALAWQDGKRIAGMELHPPLFSDLAIQHAPPDATSSTQ